MFFQGETFDFFVWMQYPPGSMFFVLILSLIVGVTSTLLTRLLVDTKELNRKQTLIKAHNEDKKKIIALAELEPDRYRKQRARWEKRDAFIKKIQQGMALQRLKPSCVTFLPMIIIFAVLRGIYGNNPVACPPMNPFGVPMLEGFVLAFSDPGTIYPFGQEVFGMELIVTNNMGWINFTAWYFICSLGTSTLLQRLLKVQTQASGGMENMFGGQKAQSAQFPDI